MTNSWPVLIVYLFVCLQCSLQLLPLPDFIHPCSELSDECFTQATLDALPGIVKGIPEANVPTLDPLYLDKNISMKLPGNVKMTFHNGKLIGLGTCVPLKVSSRRETRKFIFDIRCNFTIKGHYSIQGRILLFNLDTDGDAKIKIYITTTTYTKPELIFKTTQPFTMLPDVRLLNIDFLHKRSYHKVMGNQRIRLEVLEKVVLNEKGEGHYKINSYKYKADYGTDLKLNLTNLFRGSPEISANILAVLNQNSQLVAQEFGAPILEYAIDYAMNVTQRFFSAYTYQQISHIDVTEEFFEKE
ncbi:hypothetical protein MSG28_011964 [Choristoneura fumiferana]|uniref:Uncharacterized protein n=2 Tax=Choristoneura fumiferana TaxID=7141 RepID=A0ACC0KN63_CHOFU|nr:hypothetical protein MSG28_011964 [Choristoneura fumiferana]